MKHFKHYGLILTCTLVSFLSLQCTKTVHDNIQLSWLEVKTAKNVSLGQAIVSKVKIYYPTSSFTIYFQGFEILEKTKQHYTISANAILTSNGEGTVNTALWTMDTTCMIKPNTTGQYILDFTYAGNTTHSDTVIVQ
jgi:hypothetical protein